MSDTPETNEAWRELRENNRVQPLLYIAHKLEEERDEALLELGATQAAVAEVLGLTNTPTKADEVRQALRGVVGLAEALAKTQIELKKERDEQTAQMCQAIGYLSTIAEDCEAWLNGESDAPSMEFIKAVRDYARKAVNNE